MQIDVKTALDVHFMGNSTLCETLKAS